MTRKIDEYKLGDKVEVGRLHGDEVIDWKPGVVTEIKHSHPLSSPVMTTLLTVQLVPGGITLVYSDRDARLIRRNTDACPLNEEVEVNGGLWRGRVVSVKEGDGYFITSPRGVQQFWPAEKVRPVPVPVPALTKAMDALANVQGELASTKAALAKAEEHVAYRDTEWKRIVEVNGRLVEEAKAHAEEARRCHGEQVKAEIEVRRLAPLEAAVASWSDRAIKAEAAVAENDRKASETCRRGFRQAYEVGQAKAALEEVEAKLTKVEAELTKVKAAHGETTKAHFEASYNLGVARSERDDAQKELGREKENHLLLVKTFREVIDKLTKRNREMECELDARDGKLRDLNGAVKDMAQVNVDAIDKLAAAIRRAESAEKALAERANIYGAARDAAHDKAIADIEAMWRRKFEALEKQLADARARCEYARADAQRSCDKLTAVRDIVR